MQITEKGSGRNVMVFHGGGGPGTVAGLAAHLAASAHVLTPTLLGWNGTERPAALDSVGALAEEYLRYLDERSLTNVVAIGSSVGGWLCAELALRDRTKRIAAIVIINATGIDVAGHPVAKIVGLTPPEIAKLSFHDRSKFGAGAPPPTPESIAMMRANQASLAKLAGDDPTFQARLANIDIPALVVWGESDRVVDLEYGRAYAAAIPGARLEVIREAGHLPHLEQPAETFRVIDAFLAER